MKNGSQDELIINVTSPTPVEVIAVGFGSDAYPTPCNLVQARHIGTWSDAEVEGFLPLNGCEFATIAVVNPEPRAGHSPNLLAGQIHLDINTPPN